MERVKRKESDTWKVVDLAHEAGFILTLVFHYLCIIKMANTCIWNSVTRSTFWTCPSFLHTARQATGALRKVSTVRIAFSMSLHQLPCLPYFLFPTTPLLLCSLQHHIHRRAPQLRRRSAPHLNLLPVFPSTLLAIAIT